MRRIVFEEELEKLNKPFLAKFVFIPFIKKYTYIVPNILFSLRKYLNIFIRCMHELPHFALLKKKYVKLMFNIIQL